MKRGDGQITLPVTGPTRDTVESTAHIDEQTRDIACTSDEDYADVADMARELAARHKSLCAERDAIIKPINAGVQRVRDMYKPVLESLKVSENRMRGAMLEYNLDQKRKRDIAEQATRDAIAQGDHAAMVHHATQATTPSPTASGVHVRKTWKVRVVNEKKVPREFLTVDMSALKRYAIANGWANAPEGVEFYQEEGIALR